jgi:hypothetical protein
VDAAKNIAFALQEERNVILRSANAIIAKTTDY